MNFSAKTWVAWLGSTLIAALTMSAFVFGNFQSKDQARQDKEDVHKRLDRLESKSDRMLEMLSRRFR